MSQLISQLFGNFSDQKINPIKNPLLIYGAGNSGKDVLLNLNSRGIKALGFIDKRFETKREFQNLSVFGLQEAHEKFGENTDILIAIHNRDVNMVEVINEIKNVGFINILTMFDYVKNFPDDTSFRYFLTAPKKIISQAEQATAFYNLLSDDSSKKIYEKLLEFRLTGDYNVCPLPETERQYAPLNIPSWPKTLRLIDCGAYNGDSIKLFELYGYDFEAIIAFEPDIENYTQLIKNCEQLKAINLPCGVSSQPSQAYFNMGAGEGSRSSAEGKTMVQMISIDQAFPNWQPNLIKMDIEGGELDALIGAFMTIKNHHPGLAISAYHLPEDLWKLGLFIHSISPNYHFYLRCHAHSSFDTVLYALPK